MKVMAAVIREKSEPFTIEELDLDPPRQNEILVRIESVGLCHTDIMIQNNPIVLPAVLGHEGAGVVEQVGEQVTKVKPGDHVVLTFVSCGQCIHCQQGHPSYCLQAFTPTFSGIRPDGTTTLKKAEERIHGNFFGQSSFATHALVTERNVVKVRSDVELDILGPIGCGIQTGAGAVFNSLHVKVGSSIAVFGLGSVGLSAVMAANVSGCSTIIGIDINPERLKTAKFLGATHTINAEKDDPVSVIKEIFSYGVNYSIESTANPKVFRQAVDSLGRLGVCGLVGGAPLGTQVTFDMNSILFGRTIRGIIEGDSVPDFFIPQLVNLYLQGQFPIDHLITFYDLNQINQAADDLINGRVIKPVLRMKHV